MEKFDLFIIGAGSAGVRAARLSSSFGAKVAIAEEYKEGGTCVVRGCIPKKLMFYASDFVHFFNLSKGYGWDIEIKNLDWQSFCKKRDAEVERLSKIYGNILSNNNVTVFNDTALIIDKNIIRFKNSGKEIYADKILIASGGYPFIDTSIENYKLGIDSNEVFKLTKLPKKIIVNGGGFIAVEFACIFALLGVDVTLVYRGEKILKNYDHEAVDFLCEKMKKLNIKLVLNAKITKIEENDCKYVTINDGSKLQCDEVIFAIGRKAKIDFIADNLDIKLNKNGSVFVDENYKTSVDNIFAIGDVIDHVNLTPVAIRQAVVFANNNYNKNLPYKLKFEYDNIPMTIFSNPQYGSVGMTEEMVKKENIRTKIYTTSFAPLIESFSEEKEKIFFKLLVDANSDVVIGAHIIAPEACELIQLIGIAVKNKLTKADFDNCCAVHPSISEELVTFSNYERIV